MHNSATGSAYTPLPLVHVRRVVEVRHEVLDTGERQLHPAEVCVLAHHFAERIGAVRVAPHECIGIGIVGDLASTGAHRVSQPLGRGGRADCDARHRAHSAMRDISCR